MKQHWYEWRIIRDDGIVVGLAYVLEKEAKLIAPFFGKGSSIVRVKVTVQPTKKRKP